MDKLTDSEKSRIGNLLSPISLYLQLDLLEQGKTSLGDDIIRDSKAKAKDSLKQIIKIIRKAEDE